MNTSIKDNLLILIPSDLSNYNFWLQMRLRVLYFMLLGCVYDRNDHVLPYKVQTISRNEAFTHGSIHAKSPSSHPFVFYVFPSYEALRLEL